MTGKVYHRSNSCEWPTPQDVFDCLEARFGPFDLDAAATPENTKCVRYFTTADDGLSQAWTGTVWCNPPYGTGVTGQWIEKAIRSAHEGATVVMLVPGNTSSVWFREAWEHADEVLGISGRLKFGHAQHPTGHGSVVFVFRPHRLRSWPASGGLRYTMPKRHAGRNRWFQLKVSQ